MERKKRNLLLHFLVCWIRARAFGSFFYRMHKALLYICSYLATTAAAAVRDFSQKSQNLFHASKVARSYSVDFMRVICLHTITYNVIAFDTVYSNYLFIYISRASAYVNCNLKWNKNTVVECYVCANFMIFGVHVHCNAAAERLYLYLPARCVQ